MASLILFSDGGCRPNPGFAGFGIFGYQLEVKDKSKNIKHPFHSNLYFTQSGVHKEKDNINLEVVELYEVSVALVGERLTNNLAELEALLYALNLAKELSESNAINEVKIYTDSNYITTCFNDVLLKWIENNWRRIDSKEIIHEELWRRINEYREYFISKEIKLEIQWVKGHSDHYGNKIADLLASIAVNASKYHRFSENSVILNNRYNYKDYKLSYGDKDLIFYFKQLYFNSDPYVDDNNYCFLYSGQDNKEIGKKTLESLFAINVGYIPELIGKLKRFYREIPRLYKTLCCIKLSRLEDRELLRLMYLTNPIYLLNENRTYNDALGYSLIGENNIFIHEVDASFPFINEASNLYSNLYYLSQDRSYDKLLIIDITDEIVENKKLKLDHQHTQIDLTPQLEKHYHFLQKIFITIDRDIPSYLALKQIEEKIEKVNAVVSYDENSDTITIYVKLELEDRVLFSCNIANRYSAKKIE